MDHPVSLAVRRGLAELEAGAGARVAVACSGGPDSVALAHAAATARPGRVALVYVDHGLRPDSAADGRRVRALAEQLGAECLVTQVQVDRTFASIEAAARDARYARLDQLIDERGWAMVLLGHTASDQAETVLMRVLRGTGVQGLAAIPARRGPYARPLLTVWRADVEDYLAAHGLAASVDPMNHDEGIARVRVRRRWLPALRDENPRLDEALVRLAASAREQRRVLEYAADCAWRDARIGAGAGLSARVLAGLPPAVAKVTLARLVTAGGGRTLDAVHLERALEIIARPEAGSLSADLPGGILRREYDRVSFERFPVDERPEAGGSASDAQPDPGPLAQVRGPDGPFAVRRWQPGDRMRPERLRGRSRKLSDLFADARVPRRLRPAAVVVVRTSDDTIVWAQHIGNAYGSAVEVTLTHP